MPTAMNAEKESAMGSAERIAVYAAPDTGMRIEKSTAFGWVFTDNIDQMLSLVGEGVRVAVVDLTEGKGFEIRRSLQALGGRCPSLILITRPSNEPDVYGPTPPPEPGSPTWMVYPVNVGSLIVYIERILKALDEEQKPGEDDVVARVQPQIDAATECAEEFSSSQLI